MKKNLIRTISACIIAAVMLCAGCSDRTNENDVVEPTQAPIVLENTPAPEPVSGGTLRMPMPVNADCSDPLKVNTEEMLILYSLVYESLLTIDNSGKIMPGLAENWSVDDSGYLWTIKLRSGARWHDDSSAVGSSDVLYSYQQLKEMGDASYYSYALKYIDSVSIDEFGNLIVRMKQQGIASLYALTFPIIKAVVDSTGNYPAGTGPYMFDYVSDETVRLKVNQNWWKVLPNIETVEFYARSSNDVAIASYAAGQLDMVFTSALTVGRYREDNKTNVTDIMTQNAEVLLINYDNAYLGNIKVRQAIAYAIDRSRIITNIYMNRARTSDVPIAPDSWLHDRNSGIYDFNKELAISILGEAGWVDVDEDGYVEDVTNGYDELSLKLLVNESSDGVRKMAADQIAANLRSIGINVEIVYAGYTLGDEKSEYLNMLAEGEFDLALAGFNLSRNGDLSSYLTSGGAKNYGGYVNAGMEQLVHNVLTARTEEEMLVSTNELQRAFVEDLPFIVLYFRLNSILYDADIINITDVREPDVMSNMTSWYVAEVE